jgi:hypothetical protein
MDVGIWYANASYWNKYYSLETNQMPWKDSAGRVVVDVEICFESDSCDSFIESAFYADDGTAVPDVELEWLTEAYADAIAMEHFECAIGRASDFYEGER